MAFLMGIGLGIKIQKHTDNKSQPQKKAELNTVDRYIKNPNYIPEILTTEDRLVYNMTEDKTQIVIGRNNDGVCVSGIDKIEKMTNERPIYILDKEPKKFVPWNIFLNEYPPSSLCPIMINPNYNKQETISIPKIEDIELLDQEMTRVQLENK